MDKTEILNYLKIFKEQIEKEKINVDFKEIDKYFFIKHHFIAKEIPYFEDNFYETFLQIVGNILKGVATSLEYYSNHRSGNLVQNSDNEILKNNKEVTKIHFEFHKQLKKYNLIYLKHKQNSKEVIEYFLESYELIKKYYKFSLNIETEMLENVEKKIKEFGKDKVKFESSVFN